MLIWMKSWGEWKMLHQRLYHTMWLPQNIQAQRMMCLWRGRTMQARRCNLQEARLHTMLQLCPLLVHSQKTQCYPNTCTQEHILEVKKGCLPGYLPNCQAILPRTTWYQQDSWHFGPVMTRIYFPGWKWKKSASVTIPQLPESWAVLFSQFPHT